MAEPYYPLYYNWIEDTQELNDQEKGRLIDAIVLFARGDDWQDRIKGNERYVFPLYKNQLERARRLSAVRSEAGSKGGSSTQAKNNLLKQIQANDSKTKQSSNCSSGFDNNKKNIKEEYKEKDEYIDEEEEENARARERLIDPDWKMVADAYMKQIGPLPYGYTALETLKTYVEDLHGETVVKAIEITNEKQPQDPYSFLMKILKNFDANGVDNVQKVEAYLVERERRKANNAKRMGNGGYGGQQEARTDTEPVPGSWEATLASTFL